MRTVVLFEETVLSGEIWTFRNTVTELVHVRRPIPQMFLYVPMTGGPADYNLSAVSISDPVSLSLERPYDIRKHVAPLIDVDCSKWNDTNSGGRDMRTNVADRPAAERPNTPNDGAGDVPGKLEVP